MHFNLFDARVLEPLVGFLNKQGDRAESYLDRARIPGELIAQGGWITKKQAYDFAFDVVHQMRSADAVFTAYLDFELRQIGPIGDAMKSGKTVKESLEIGTRLGSIAYEGSEYFLWINGDTTWFCYREPTIVSAGQTFINDMTLSVYYHLIRIMANEVDWRPERLLTRGEVIDRHRPVEHFQDCQAGFHPHYSALAFPTEFLSRRTPWQQPSAEVDASRAWSFGPDGSEPIVDTLYRLLASCFHFRKPPTLEHMAWILDVSPATLKREMASVGMSYRRLLDRFRFDTACEMLSIPQIGIQEMALELGYSGTNNFVRSFRRMTGLTPGEYRRRQFTDDGQC